MDCYHCHTSFTYHFAHSGFGDEDFFYCDQCGAVAIVDWYSKQYRPFYEKYIHKNSYEAQKPESLAKFSKDKHDMLIEISQHLATCPCGGKFTIDAAPRCPYCKKRLLWKKIRELLQLPYTPNNVLPSARDDWSNNVYYFIFNDRPIFRNFWMGK